MAEKSILDQVYSARYGGSLTAAGGTRLAGDLLLFRRKLENAQLPPLVSATAIRRWLSVGKKHRPKRAGAMKFLHEYVLWIKQTGAVVQVEAAESLLQSLRRHIEPVTGTQGQAGFVQEQSHSRGHHQLVIRSMLESSATVMRSERDDYFKGREEERDKSF